MVDTNFNNFCDKIQSFFDDLKDLTLEQVLANVRQRLAQ
jgi:hypothetical protein